MNNDFNGLDYRGLSTDEAKRLFVENGPNELIPRKRESILYKVLDILKEPMFLLLIAAAIIYFLLGEESDGAIMLVFVIGIISIDVIQEWKTDRTLSALKELSQPHISVLRDGAETEIASNELVVGDLMFLCEGVKIPADGVILRCSDFCVDESSLTGEAIGVWKRADGEGSEGYWRTDRCYAGTLVTQGSAAVRVDKTGAATEYGKIGMNVASAPAEQTPLQKQTRSLVRISAVIAGVLFLLVCIVTWFNVGTLPIGERLTTAVLSGITLAMAMIPEEFPVILTVFLSMGAWRLAKKHSLVRRLPSVETLGAVTVLCVDKTGTLTTNSMTVTETHAISDNFVELCGLACEPEAYDPMEHAILEYCNANSSKEIFDGELIHEYPFTNEQKMMGHIWSRGGECILAAKGSPERIFALCDDYSLADEAEKMSSRGLRVIAVASSSFAENESFPETLQECKPTLCGLIALSDPVREGVPENIALCKSAGIRVIMITGDNGTTASSIASQTGIEHSGKIVTGDMLNAMTDDELRETVREVCIFSRVVPEHKMRIVRALRDNGEVVAMTGDGVNDAPALKYADIGIAMGKRGSEVSREAADLVLMDDNFSTIVDTIHDGRRIYDNIRRAVGYVFSIHIPIALISLIVPLLGIATGDFFFLPLHVVLLELVIDPTCSVVLERQPAERDAMKRPPRSPSEKLLDASTLFWSIIQGVMIFAASFSMYFAFLGEGSAIARTMGLTIIILANLFLVQENSSHCDPVWKSIGRLAHDKVMWVINLITLAGLGVIIYSPLSDYLKLEMLSPRNLLFAVLLAAVSVFWFELVKLARRHRSK